MANLVNLIAEFIAQEGYGEFTTYANQLDALAISQSILNGSGPTTMKQAFLEWANFRDILEKLVKEHEELIKELPSKWSGESAYSMQTKLTAHTKWMKAILAEIRMTVSSLENAYTAYCTTCDNVVNPNEILRNYSNWLQVKAELSFSNSLAELEEERHRFHAQNVFQMLNYYYKAVEADKLSEFPDPLGAASAGNAKSHRPGSRPMSSGDYFLLTPVCAIS